MMLIKDLFEKEGIKETIGSNTPLLLNDKNAVYYILSGNIEVFSVQAINDIPTGQRLHFFTVEQDNILFGMDLEKVSLMRGLLAVGNFGTTIIKISLTQFRQSVLDPAYFEPLCVLFDNWINNLSFGAAKTIENKPVVDLILAPFESIFLTEGETLGTKKDILWTHIEEGRLVYLGMEDLEAEAAPIFFPITNNTWAQAAEPSQVSSIDTKTALLQETFWDNIDYFYEKLFSCDTWNTSLIAVDELNRLKEKINIDKRAYEIALKNLTISAKHPTLNYETQLDDPLFAACYIIGLCLKVSIKKPPIIQNNRSKDPLIDIAKASGFRVRQVILEHNWWNNESGPLLGFLKQNYRPVALIPIKNKYVLYDTVKKRKRIVLASNVNDILHYAYTFYKPFKLDVLSNIDLLKFSLRTTKNDIFILFSCGVIGGLLALFPPLAVLLLFNHIVPDADKFQLEQLFFGFILAAIASVFFHISRNVAMLRITEKMDASLQSATWDRLLNLPATFFRKFLIGDLALRALGIHTMRKMLTENVISSFLSAIFSIFLIGLLFYLDKALALVSITGFFIISLLFIWIGTIYLSKQKQLQQEKGRISSLLLQFMTGIEKLKVSSSKIRAFAAWSKLFSNYQKISSKLRKMHSITDISISIFHILSLIMLFSMTFLFRSKPIPTGTFIAFFTAYNSLLLIYSDLVKAYFSILETLPVFERSKPIFESLPEKQELKTIVENLKGNIEVSNVCFRYAQNTPLILDNLSFNIKPREFVAFVGPSGSGKSTIVRLLLGFEHPDSGSIYYDGNNLDRLDIQSVRRQIGTVLQNSLLLPGSIFSNIIGARSLTIDDAWEAARLAGLDEDIQNLPMGMDTIITEGGSNFSGGQRQRLLIARALVTKPRILFFDEATSALDNYTQSLITDSIENTQATRIVIAHRLSTIIKADRIFVLDNGRIIQSGNYNELISQSGLFKDFVQRQLISDNELAPAS
jgi:NHLM bacteriocin system ABC transporter ATP-binding protein